MTERNGENDRKLGSEAAAAALPELREGAYGIPQRTWRAETQVPTMRLGRDRQKVGAQA